MPKVKQRLDGNGTEPLLSTPEQMTAMIRSQTAELEKLIRTASIKVD